MSVVVVSTKDWEIPWREFGCWKPRLTPFDVVIGFCNEFTKKGFWACCCNNKFGLLTTPLKKLLLLGACCWRLIPAKLLFINPGLLFNKLVGLVLIPDRLLFKSREWAVLFIGVEDEGGWCWAAIVEANEFEAWVNDGPETKCSLIETGADVWSFKSSKINSDNNESTSARPKNWKYGIINL